MRTTLTRLLARGFWRAFNRLPPGVQVRFLGGGLRSVPPAVVRKVVASQWGRIPTEALGDLVFQAFRRLPVEESLALAAQLDVTERLDYPSADIYLAMTTPSEHIRRQACQKEPWTVKWIEEAVQPGQVLYDVGANVGAYSLVAAARTRGQAKVFAFEPAFGNFAALCRNIILNGCQDSIVPLPLAIGERTCLTFFNYTDCRAGTALHTLGDQIDQEGKGFQPVYRQLLLAYGIDGLIREFQLPVPNHIKIDVDGTELAVLSGAASTLSDPAMMSMMIEISEPRAPASTVSGFLEAKGWRLAARYDLRDAQGNMRGISYLHFSKEH